VQKIKKGIKNHCTLPFQPIVHQVKGHLAYAVESLQGVEEAPFFDTHVGVLLLLLPPLSPSGCCLSFRLRCLNLVANGIILLRRPLVSLCNTTVI